MKKVLFGTILLFLPIFLWSQGIRIGFQSGIEGTLMHELKDFNTYIKSTIPFETKIISNFPAYWYYQPSLGILIRRFGIGLNYSYNSTGSRISGKDYSGEYRFDMRLNKKSPGVFVDYLLTVSDIGFCLGAELTGGLMYSTLHTEQYLMVNNSTLSNDSYLFISRNYFFQPGFNVTYSWHSFEFEINIGYLFQFGEGTFQNKSDKQLVLINNSTGNAIKPDWQGLKLGVTVNFVLINSI